MSFFKLKKALSPRHSSKSPPLEMLRCFSSPDLHAPPPIKPRKSRKTNKKTATKTLKYYQNLIEITLLNPNKSTQMRRQRLISSLHSELIHGWDISQSVDRIFYRLKPVSNTESTIIVIENINECLLFSFEKFLDLSKKPSLNSYSFKLKWVYLAYNILIQSLTLQQKALLFCKCSQRKNRTYKLIHSYKNCIVGKQSVDLLIHTQICKNRKAAVNLGQEFIDRGYMCHVEKEHNFKDGNFWYILNDESVKYSYANFKRYSDDHKDDEMSIVYENNNANAYVTMASSDEEDNDFMLRDIEEQIIQNAIHKNQRIHRLGTNHTTIMEWLLSLYTMKELTNMCNDKLRALIHCPNNGIGLEHSSTNTVQRTVECSVPSKDEIFLGYNKRMHLQSCNTYKLNVRPFGMSGIDDKQRKHLLSVHSMTFDTFVKCLRFILCDLWYIFNEMCKDIYFKMIEDLTMVEKCKMVSIGVETKNRLKNLKKYKQCFIGTQAVTFLVNARLAPNRKAAVRLGNMFCKKKWVKHVRNEYMFGDKDFYYKIIEDEVENRLDELRLYRKQQRSNHVNISLDITHGIEEDEESMSIYYDYYEHHKYESSYQIDSMNLDYFHSKKNTKSTSLDVESYFDD